MRCRRPRRGSGRRGGSLDGGGAVALKLDAVELAHKSDLGLVRLGLVGDDAVRAAAAELLAAARGHGLEVRGLLVEPMAEPGVELIVGLRRDASFGPAVVVGLGGVLTEVLDDVAIRLAPVDHETACRCSRSCAARGSSTGCVAHPRSIGRPSPSSSWRSRGSARPGRTSSRWTSTRSSPRRPARWRSMRWSCWPGRIGRGGRWLTNPSLLTTRTPWGVRLTLNRPAKLNALNGALVSALVAALDAAEADADVRVIVLEGAGRAFSSGYDLTEEAEGAIGGPVEWRDLLAADVAATLRFLDSPKPVIAQVHGYALAGGLELAMACDLVVAAEGTKLGEPEIRYGSAPVTLLMPFLIGQKRTRELLLTGDLIDAVEAERIGLVNRVVPLAALAAEVDALADRLARTPPEVMGPTKRMLNRAMDAAGFRLAVEAGLDLGAIINAADTPEQREWDAIVRRDGLKAALAWRDRRYEERLGASGVEPSD